MKVIGIYKIISPTGKIYIGQSTDVHRRLKIYKTNFCKGQPRLHNSFLKHGTAAHIYEVIKECTVEELNIWERHYQDEYDVLGARGLNCGLTGTPDKIKVHGHETKTKITTSNKLRISRKRSFYELTTDEQEEVRERFVMDASPENIHNVLSDEYMSFWYWVEDEGTF